MRRARLQLEPVYVYPEFIGPRVFLDEKVRPAVLAHATDVLARNDVWASGSKLYPLLPGDAFAHHCVSSLLARYEPGYSFDREELTTLFHSRVPTSTPWSNERQCSPRPRGDNVTFVINRNINYTNVCTFKCRFCAFSKGPLSLNLRVTPTC